MASSSVSIVPNRIYDRIFVQIFRDISGFFLSNLMLKCDLIFKSFWKMFSQNASNTLWKVDVFSRSYWVSGQWVANDIRVLVRSAGGGGHRVAGVLWVWLCHSDSDSDRFYWFIGLGFLLKTKSKSFTSHLRVTKKSTFFFIFSIKQYTNRPFYFF